jgi:hypothetical protein
VEEYQVFIPPILPSYLYHTIVFQMSKEDQEGMGEVEGIILRITLLSQELMALLEEREVLEVELSSKVQTILLYLIIIYKIFSGVLGVQEVQVETVVI